MHPFELVVDRDQLALDVVGMRQSVECVKGTLEACFGIHQQPAVGGSRFVGHPSDPDLTIQAWSSIF